MKNDPVNLETGFVHANVYLTGALLTDVAFLLNGGTWVEPLATPTWSPTSPHTNFGHMRRLGGEFFCLPFGGSAMKNTPCSGWGSFATEPECFPLHGPCANENWSITERQHDQITLRLDFPETHPVEFVTRRIKLSQELPRIDIEVTIGARRSTALPAAFHPILRLPEVVGGLKLDCEFSLGLTYPGTIESDRMAAKPGKEFRSISAVPGENGEIVDFSLLPLGPALEDVVLLAGVQGPIRADYLEEDFQVVLDWDREHLPHCLIWIHDRGIKSEPWSGQYRGLGIEPMAAAFDGPWELSAKPNPLSARGYPTTLRLEPNSPRKLDCSIRVEGI